MGSRIEEMAEEEYGYNAFCPERAAFKLGAKFVLEEAERMRVQEFTGSAEYVLLNTLRSLFEPQKVEG